MKLLFEFLLGSNVVIVFVLVLFMVGILFMIISGMVVGFIFVGIFGELYYIKDSYF